jgi:hypothetical protein
MDMYEHELQYEADAITIFGDKYFRSCLQCGVSSVTSLSYVDPYVVFILLK